MLFFLISALRAIVEMLGLCLLAQGVLYLLAGQGRYRNPVYQFFALIGRGPQNLLARYLPAGIAPHSLALLTFLLLLALWIGLAILRKLL